MARFDSNTVRSWCNQVDQWISKNSGITDRAGVVNRDHVTRGVDAWTIAHRSGITQEAYQDRHVTDAHIVTALKKIFPNAVFADRYPR